MVQHPWGHTIKIFGIEAPTNGRSCEEHAICGSVLQDNVVVQLRKVQVLIEEKEETAIAAFWVSDGVDRLETFGRGSCPDHRSIPSRKQQPYKEAKVPQKQWMCSGNTHFLSHYIRDPPPLPHKIQEAKNSRQTRRRKRIQY